MRLLSGLNECFVIEHIAHVKLYKHIGIPWEIKFKFSGGESSSIYYDSKEAAEDAFSHIKAALEGVR